MKLSILFRNHPGTAALLGLLIAGCNPTVRVEAPKDPIVINMNLNIKHKVTVKTQQEIQDLVKNNPDLF